MNTVPSRINPKYKMHMLVKYECLECEKSFILSQKQADESEEITCPYCKAENVESVSMMVDSDQLEELGCMGIGHVEESEGIE